jgi:hypothetical protein
MMTMELVCPVKFMLKEKLLVGHAFCAKEEKYHLHHNINNAQLVIRPSKDPSTHQSVNQPINKTIFAHRRPIDRL